MRPSLLVLAKSIFYRYIRIDLFGFQQVVVSLVSLWSLQKCDQGLWSRGGGGTHAPSIILPQLPLKNPYNNLKRRSLEKKPTCFDCGFVFTFLSFYLFVLTCQKI